MKMIQRDSAGKILVAIGAEVGIDMEELLLCDYVVIRGQRFNREMPGQAERRSAYEPGGEFAHLYGVLDH